VLGELWTARSNQAVKKDAKLKVVGMKGLVLLVEPVDQSEREKK
jgi:membrane-bound ClpP family serine protease